MSYGEFKFTCIEDLKIRESALSESSMTLSPLEMEMVMDRSAPRLLPVSFTECGIRAGRAS
jgi:hypothetical protein